MAIDSTKNTLYISQRAANAIIADVAPYRISSEALLAINTFLDEFLYFLVDSARSLDLIRIKLAIGQVLPTSLGKNAVVEAELELKTYVESGNSDHTKEKTIEITPFPLQKVFEQFRVKCQFFSTLGERGADDRDLDSVPDLYASEGIHIAPSLAIYLTAALEYVGEYILILVAKASEKQGVEVARAQEVYSALSEDSQIFPLFRKTNLKKQMEEEYNSCTIPVSKDQTKGSINITTSQTSARISSESSAKLLKTGDVQSSTLYSPRSPTKSSSYSGDIGRERQTSLDGFGIDWKKGPTSPVKSPSDYRQSSEHKNVGMRSTKSMQSLQRQGDRESDLRSVSSMEDSIEKMKSFETLISSNQTMKVSLTPNRLITIETHKRPPKLAPREPVSRERIIQKSSPTSPSKEFDDDDDDLLQLGKRKHKKDKEESLWEFLKNTSPDDMLGDKVKKKDDISRRRGKPIDKLESVPKTPGSGNNPRYTPLIPSAKSSPSSPYQSDRINATIDHTLSSSDDQTITSPTLSTYTSPSSSNYYSSAKSAPLVPSKPKPRPDPLDLLDDDDLLNPKPKRRHENQDLIDFLSSSPPKDSILNNGVGKSSLDTSNVGKKKEKKLKKLLSKLKKSSLNDEYTSSLNGQRPASASVNSFSTTNTYVSNSTAGTLVNKPARYVKIEIPKIPPKEDNQEQSIFDQVEIQGRHARQVSRASLSSSTRSLQYTPNRSTFSTTGGMTSPTTILEKKPNNKLDDYDEYMGITTERLKNSQKPTNISNIQPSHMNTSTLLQSSINSVQTYPINKIPSPVSPSRQKSYNNNIINKTNNNQTSSQEISKATTVLPKEQKLNVSEALPASPILAVKSSTANKRKSQPVSTKALQSFIPSGELPSINNKNNINENEKIEEVQAKPEKVVTSKEPAQNKEVIQSKHEVLASKKLAQNKEVIQSKSEAVASKKPAQNKEVIQSKSEAVTSKKPVQNKEVKAKVVVSEEPAQNKEIIQSKSEAVTSKEPVQNKEVKSKVVVSDESAQNKEIISHDGFLASIIEAEISVLQDMQEITIMTYNEEEELEEAFVVEWLLGTNLTFKDAITYVDITQVYEDEEVPEMEKSEYEDADDTDFIDDRDDEHIVTRTGKSVVTGNVVQVGA